MTSQRKRVLAIDDDVKVGRAVSRMLAREYDVVVLTSGDEALSRLLAGERFDLILCDVIMPEMNGVKFHERLSVIAPDLVERVVFMTGGGFTAEAKAFLARPDVHQIGKPLTLVEFRQAVAEHVQRLASRR